jgi:phosphohistidine phosphatase
LAHQLHYPEADIRVETDIYDQGAAYLMELLYGLPNEVSSVMLIGHNPTFTHFANKFMDKSIDALATTGTVSISFDTDKWEELHLASKITNFVIVPKMLKH